MTLGSRSGAFVCVVGALLCTFFVFFELKASNWKELCGQHVMDDRIDSAIKKQIMPGSRFWNKILPNRKKSNELSPWRKRNCIGYSTRENQQFGLSILIPSRNRRLYLLPNNWIDMPDHMHFGRFYFSIPIYFFNDEFDCGKVNCARIPGLSEEKGRCKKIHSRRRLFSSDYKSGVWSLQGCRYLLKFIDLQDLKLSKWF